MNTPRKGWGCGWLAMIVVGILLLTLFTPLKVLVWMPFMAIKIARAERQLQQPRVYEPLATNLALYCQSMAALNLTNRVPDYSSPPPPTRTGKPWAMFETNRARVEYGGGFHHYGYLLVLDAATSTSSNNVWNLKFQREGSPDRTLMQFSLPSSARLPN